jgi:hypothetical protein
MLYARATFSLSDSIVLKLSFPQPPLTMPGYSSRFGCSADLFEALDPIYLDVSIRFYQCESQYNPHLCAFIAGCLGHVWYSH